MLYRVDSAVFTGSLWLSSLTRLSTSNGISRSSVASSPHFHPRRAPPRKAPSRSTCAQTAGVDAAHCCTKRACTDSGKTNSAPVVLGLCLTQPGKGKWSLQGGTCRLQVLTAVSLRWAVARHRSRLPKGVDARDCLTRWGYFRIGEGPFNAGRKGLLFGEMDATQRSEGPQRSRPGKGPGPEGREATPGAFPASGRQG